MNFISIKLLCKKCQGEPPQLQGPQEWDACLDVVGTQKNIEEKSHEQVRTEEKTTFRCDAKDRTIFQPLVVHRELRIIQKNTEWWRLFSVPPLRGQPASSCARFPSNHTEKMHPQTCLFNWAWWLNPVSPARRRGLNGEARGRCESWVFVLLVY